MKLEYLGNISDNGKYPVLTDELVRLYGFDVIEATALRDKIQEIVIEQNKPLEIDKLEFIEAVNCGMTLRITDDDLGIKMVNTQSFYCDLTLSGYKHMIYLLEPFCSEEKNGYQWLCDADSPIEFLFSPGGYW